jgi:hypothetical protein
MLNHKRGDGQMMDRAITGVGKFQDEEFIEACLA